MPATTNSVDAVVNSAASTLIPALSYELKAMAKESGWPDEITAGLSVTFDGESLVIDPPDNIKKAVDDLEYGKGSNLPNSVIRSFAYRSGDTVKSVLANDAVLQLFELEGVFDE